MVDPSYRTGMDLTDQQWTIIEPFFEEKRRPDCRGRPWPRRACGNRAKRDSWEPS
jgi:hypothetical protein